MVRTLSLKEFKGTFLIVSHKEFLKKITNKVFWIDRGKISSPKGFCFLKNEIYLNLSRGKRVKK